MIKQAERRLGNYHLNRLIGHWGFADVYLGTHIYLNIQATIKILRGRLDGYVLERFLTGAQHLSHLVHPHIIRILDFGIEQNTPFLVMDYAPGGNLRQLHPPGTRVALPSVLSYVHAIASALQYAHDEHLIHRDLKPENLLLGARHELLLSDFWLALLASSGQTLPMQPHPGALSYMAPEQIEGWPSPVSDQYALALIIYEWLSGQPLFAGKAAQLSRQQRFMSAMPLSQQDREIPAAIEPVLSKALSREPARRYMDVLTFACAFEDACQSNLLVPAPTVQPASVSIEVGGNRAEPGTSQDPLWNMPTPLAPLIGREQELRAAHARLLRPEVRLLTLTGAPGVGKSRLALALGARLQEMFAQGIYFVPLASVSDPDMLVPATIRASGLSESLALSPLEHLVANLREKEILLFLDDFLHLLPAASQLAELLSACPRLKILVTSRAALHLQGEYEFVVPPLVVPDLHRLPEPEALTQVEAVALFLQCAEAVDQEFELTRDNAATIARICVHLDGLPLAIELAAARSKLLTLEALLTRLEAGLEVLTGGKQNVPPHQQSLRGSISWSYDHLTTEEQRVFRWLAVFVGAFTLEAAEALGRTLGDLSFTVLEGVASLIDKSLVQRHKEQGQEPHFYLLDLVRRYAVERLGESGELEICRDAHAAYYLALAEHGPLQQGWLQGLRHEHENLLAAMQWLLERREAARAMRMALALGQYWNLCGLQTQDRSFLDRASALREQGMTPQQARRAGTQISPHEEFQPLLATEFQLIPACDIRDKLTARELEVLYLLAQGMSNRRIAEQLNISPFTANRHVQTIYDKLGVNSRSAATRFAVEHHLV